jgi:hypothetical protein
MSSIAPKVTTLVYTAKSYCRFVNRVLGGFCSHQIKPYVETLFSKETEDFRKDVMRLIITIKISSEEWNFASENEAKEAVLYAAVWKLAKSFFDGVDGLIQALDRDYFEPLKDTCRKQ